MSTTVDKKVVEMQFNNSQFENNVKTSLSTLDKLKKSLNLSDSAKGLDSLTNSSKKFNLSGLTDGIEAVKVKFSGLQVVAATALSNITTAAMNAGGRLYHALTDSIVQGGVRRAMNLENAHFQLQGLLKDEDKVQAVMADVSESVDDTAYSLDAAATVASQFAASGVQAGDQMLGALKGVTGVAATTNSEFSDIGRIFATVAGNGRLMGDQLNQLGQRGMNAAAALTTYFNDLRDESSEASQKTREDVRNAVLALTGGAEMTEQSLRELVSKGKINFDIFSEAMNVTFGEHAKDANKTFNGSMSNVKAALARIGAEFVAPLIKQEGPLVNMFNALRVVINDVKAEIAPFANMFTSAVIKIVDGITAFLTKVHESEQAKVFMAALHNIVLAVANVFNVLKSVLSPIKEAFKSIFPPKTLIDFLRLTERIRDFTSSLKVSDKTTNNIKNTFRGLFAILAIVKNAFVAVWNALAPVREAFGNLVSHVLEYTASMGLWLVRLNNTIRVQDIFTKALQKVSEVIVAVYEKIKPFVTAVVQAVGKVKNAIMQSGFLGTLQHVWEGVKEKVKGIGDTLGTLAASAKDAFGRFKSSIEQSGFMGFIQKLWGAVKKIGGAVKDSVVKVIEGLVDSLKNIDFGKIAAGFSAISAGGIAGLIGKALFGKNTDKGTGFNIFDTIFNNFNGMIENIKGILGSIKDCFAAYQNELKADTLIKIAGAIALLVASIVVLSTIDAASLGIAVAGISALFGELVGSLAIMDKIGGDSKKSFGTLLGFALSISILAGALKNLSDLNWNSLAVGLVGITALMGEMVLAVKVLSNEDGTSMTKGIGNTILLAAAIKILASACEDLSGLSWEELGKGLAGVGGLLLELGAFSRLAGDSGGLAKTGVSVVLIAASMKIFADAIERFNTFSWAELGKGLAAMGGALLAVGVAMRLMPSNGLALSLGLIAVGAALNIMAAALGKYAGMSWEEIGKGLVVLGGSLAIVAAGLFAMSKTGAGTLALMGASVALLAMVPVLLALGSMSWEAIAKGLVALAGAFAVIGIAGALLGPILPYILGLAAAMALLGIGIGAIGAGIFAAGVGLQAIIAALGTLAIAGTAGATALVASLTIIVTGLADLIPLIIAKLGEGIVAFVQTLLESKATIVETGISILVEFLDKLAANLPKILQALGKILSGILSMIRTYTPQIVSTGIGILLSVITGIKNNIGQITSAAIDVVLNFIRAIEDKFPEVLQEGWNLIINFINGIANSIRDNMPQLIEAINNLFDAIVEAAILILTNGIPLIKQVGQKIMNSGLIQGIKDKFVQLWNTIKTMMANAIARIREKFSEWKTAGMNLIVNVITGIHNKIEAIKQKIADLISAAKSKITEKFSEWLTAGQDLIANIISGIGNKLQDIKDKVAELIRAGKDRITDFFEGFKANGKSLLSNVISGIGAKIEDIKNKVWEVVNAALEKIRGFWESFRSAGKYLTNGLADGIGDTAAVNRAKSKAANAVSEAIAAANARAKINSPSKVTMITGRSLVEGLAVGISKNTGLAKEASSEAAQETMDSMRNSLAKISEYVVSGIDTEPVIKPVLDLSNIASGTKSLNAMFSSNRALSVGAIGSSMFAGGINAAPGNVYNFTQNNYSPKALSRIDIYRQTRSQFSALRRTVDAS